MSHINNPILASNVNTYFFDVIIAGGLNINTFLGLFFYPIFILPNGGWWDRLAVKFGFILSSLSLSDPTLQILYENNLFHYCTLLPEMNPILLTEPIIQGSCFQ